MTYNYKQNYLIIIFLLGALLYYYFFMVVDTPLILADEGGYIANARYLATGKGLIDLRDSVYYPGVSLFYMPIFYFTDDLQVAYKYMQLVNLLFALALPIVVYKIFASFCQNKNTLIALSFFVFLYPAVFSYINLALPEVFITLLFLISILVLQKYSNTKNTLYIILLSFFVFLLLLSHPRNIVILIAINMTAFIWMRDNKKDIIILFALTLIGYLVSNEIISNLKNAYMSIALDDRVMHSTSLLNPSAILAKNLASIDDFKGFLLTAFGQVWYLTISSLGLVWVGLFSLIHNIFNNKNRIVSTYILLSACGILVLSSMFMNGAPRGDHMIYGRYNEYIWIIVMLFGLYEMLSETIEKKLLIKIFALASIVLLTYPYISREIISGRTFNDNNILGVYIFKYFFHYDLVKYAYAGLFLTLGLYILIAFRKKIIFLALVIAFLIISNYKISRNYYLHDSNGRLHEKVLLWPFKSIVKKHVIIGYDLYGFDTWHFLNYQLYSDKIRMYRFFSDKTLEKHNFDFVISGHQKLNNKYYIIGMENYHNQTLFINKSSKYFPLCKSFGYILPTNFPCALPKEAYKYEFINPKIENQKLFVRLHDLGTKSFWPNLYGLKQPQYSVRVGMQYLNKGFKKIAEDRVELKKSIYPNEITDIKINLPKECKSKYIKIDLVQEAVTWFEPYGNTPIILECKNNQYKLLKDLPK